MQWANNSYPLNLGLGFLLRAQKLQKRLAQWEPGTLLLLEEERRLGALLRAEALDTRIYHHSHDFLHKENTTSAHREAMLLVSFALGSAGL